MWRSTVWRPWLFLACDHMAGSEIHIFDFQPTVFLFLAQLPYFTAPPASFWFWLWEVGFLHYSTVLGYQYFSLSEPSLFSPFSVFALQPFRTTNLFGYPCPQGKEWASVYPSQRDEGQQLPKVEGRIVPGSGRSPLDSVLLGLELMWWEGCLLFSCRFIEKRDPGN